MTDRLLVEYDTFLTTKNPGTAGVYRRAIRQFVEWLESQPGGEEGFDVNLLTSTAVEGYLAYLEGRGYSTGSRHLAKAAISHFATWLMDTKDLLQRNPTRRIQIPVDPLMAPRMLNDRQRYTLRNLVERESGVRGSALFALGYWAGCRVSDISWLTVENAHITQRTGWLAVGHKGGKTRRIDLCQPAHQALGDYIKETLRLVASPYLFFSQRSIRLTEAGIHHWFRQLKDQARPREWELIADVAFHDLRHDFAHRAREAGWTLEELAYYLGHVTRKGAPAIQTTARYTQVGHEQIQAKLNLIRG